LIETADTPSFDRLNTLPEFTFDGRELLAAVGNARAMFHPQTIQLAYVLAAEVLEEITSHQLVAKRDQDALLHLLAADRQAIGARASRANSEAG
jgi:hypothetical protein